MGMFYIVYRSTNLVNGKVYVGMHQTNHINDGYLGSGTLIKRALKKYGARAFTKEILAVFDNPEDMRTREREIVTQDFCERKDTYNLNVGGDGGWSYVNQTLTQEQRTRIGRLGNQARDARLAQDPVFMAEEQERARKMGLAWNSRRPKESFATFTGRRHSETTKAKMRGPRASFQGMRNSQFGTVWVHKAGERPRKIPGAELPAYTEVGWQRGRG